MRLICCRSSYEWDLFSLFTGWLFMISLKSWRLQLYITQRQGFLSYPHKQLGCWVHRKFFCSYVWKIPIMFFFCSDGFNPLTNIDTSGQAMFQMVLVWRSFAEKYWFGHLLWNWNSLGNCGILRQDADECN